MTQRTPTASAQSARINGSHNILVQAQGNGITIDVNQPHLTLGARHRLAREPKKYLDLLNPINRAIKLVGRDRELRDLESWLDDGPGVSARCLFGGAGSGKTRLAVELGAAAEKRGWFAGFIDHGELDRFRGQQNLSAWDWPKPTLIVVDYAAAKARVLRDWLAELAQRSDGSAEPLRLLLLERHAERDLGWWQELTTPRGWAEEGLRDMFNPSALMPLDNIVAIEDRRQILEAVMAAASKLPGAGKALRPPRKGEDPAFDHRLADPSLQFAPLHLLMAGILGVEQGVPALLVLGPPAMAKQLAGYELGRIDNFARDRGLSRDFLRYLSVGITLLGGSSHSDLDPMIDEEAQALGYQDARPAIAGALRDALQGEERNQIAPILPDLIGEAAVIEVIGGLAPTPQAAAIKRWHRRAPRLAIAGIIRIVQDYATNDSHPALAWFDAIVADASEFAALVAIAAQIPERSVVLVERATRIYASIVGILRTMSAAPDDQSITAALAMSLNNLANRLSALGRREEALAGAQEAVDLYRGLAAARPDAFRPALAMSLNNLANRLSELGRREEALAGAQEAVAIRRALAAARPDAFRPDLAGSLNNLAAMLGELGRREEALALAQEAVAIYRALAAARPDAFRPNLARSLSVLADRLEEMERNEEAILIDEEGVTMLAPYLAATPLAFVPLMRAILSDYERRCAKVGREPDRELLGPILKIFKKLEDGGG